MDPHRGNIIHIGDIAQKYIHVYSRNENIAKSNEAAMGGKGQPLYKCISKFKNKNKQPPYKSEMNIMFIFIFICYIYTHSKKGLLCEYDMYRYIIIRGRKYIHAIFKPRAPRSPALIMSWPRLGL